MRLKRTQYLFPIAILICLASLLFGLPVSATSQTKVNLQRYTQTAMLGRGSIVDARWRHDGSAFVVNSSRGAWIYSRDFADLAHFEDARLAVFSPSGKYLAWAKNTPNAVEIQDAQNFKLVTTIAGEDEANLTTAIAISPDDSQIALSNYKNVRVFEIASGRQVYSLPVLSPAASLTWCADGRLLAIGDYLKVEIVDTSTWRVRADLIQEGALPQTLWSPDGQLIATLSVYSKAGGPVINALKVWDARTFQLRVVMQAPYARSFAWSPDSANLVAGYDDYVGYPVSVLNAWNAQTGEIVGMRLADVLFRKPVLSVEWKANGSEILLAGADNMVRLYAWPPQTDHNRILTGFSDEITALDWSPDGTKIVSTSTDGGIHLWDTRSGKTIATFEQMYDTTPAIAWSPNGTQIAVGGVEGGIHIWDVVTKAEVEMWSAHGMSVDPTDGRGVSSLAWKPNTHILASGGWDKKARIWDTSSTPNDALQVFEEKNLTGVKVAWSPKGDFLAGLSNPGYTDQIHIWEPRSGKVANTLECAGCNFGSLVWSPDGSKIAAGGWYGDHGEAVLIWDTRSGALIRHLSVSVVDLDWSRIGAIAVRTGYDQISIWESAESDTPTLLDTIGARVIKWSPDGKRLAVGNEDGTIMIWEQR
ncbi:MAG: hypothetical protein H0X30_21115 [Anaerolineae bacterium]|nr:hypothetical protein [Anaerolineae bacterium]